MSRPLHRPISVGLVIALALALSALTPRPADAHDSCAIAQPAANGVLGVIVAAIDLFAPVVQVSTSCPDKFGDVQPLQTRDWTVPKLSASERASAATLEATGGREAGSTYAPCEAGEAAESFSCENVDLLSHVTHAELGTERLNDIWGWTDPETGNDYALVGSTTGTAFVDITDAMAPKVLGFMDSASFEGGASWRDIKVYADHAYVVSEHTNHGVQVFDLTRLRDHDGGYVDYEADALYTGHGSAHNININEDTGYLYSVGAGPYSAQGLPYSVAVDTADGVVSYLATGAAFGPAPTQDGVSGDLELVQAGENAEFPGADPELACGPLEGFTAGNIAVTYRGVCGFAIKAEFAQAAGATALVVINNAPGSPINMGGAGDVDIPAVMVSDVDGDAIVDELPTSGTVLANDPPPLCGTGLHMIDINEPKSPTFAGCFDDHGYIHDTQCVIYDGPDTEHHAKEICFNSNGISYTADPAFNFVSIVDVTDKSDPVSLSRLGYEGSGYSHQGWLTEDMEWFLHGDEGDEQIHGVNTTTRVWDVRDLDDPKVHEVFENDTTSIDHNLYTKDGFAYAANYTSGLRVYDARDPENDGLSEVGYFDMYPENDAATFEGGPWSNFPYFAQEDIVAVSSIDRGLFVLRPTLPVEDDDDEEEPGRVCENVPPQGFPDVPGRPPHGGNIGCVAGFGIAEGRADGGYHPLADVRRDQMASFIARMLEVAGVDLPANPSSGFSDVTGGQHALAIRQLADLGVVEGRGGGRYAPASAVTRAQMASFIIRSVELVLERDLTAPASPFGDVAGNTHRANIDVAYDLGIAEGRADGNYHPLADVRRDQMASFIARSLQVLADEGVTLTPR